MQNWANYHLKFLFIKNKFPVLHFLITFIFIFFLFFRLLYLEYLVKVWHPKIIYVTAFLPHFILTSLGEPVHFTEGSMITSSKFSLQVIIDCCALEPVAIFTAAVIAYPSTILQKMKGLTVSLPLFFSINIIRIVSLYYFGTYVNIQTMDRMHLDVWQVLQILFSITLFFFWIKWTNHKNKCLQIP